MAALQQLKSPPGLAVTTAMQTLYTNPANSAVREIVQVTLNSIDSVNDAAATLNWVDVSNGNLALPILPTNVKVPKADSVSQAQVLDPGDYLQVVASANGDVVAIVTIVGREAVAP